MKKDKIRQGVVVSGMFLAIFLLVYTRFVNIGWGLPYPFHPDERNMADAVRQLTCNLESLPFTIQSCFNPHFFAYGQLPIYLAFIIAKIDTIAHGSPLTSPISFEQSVLALRFIAAISSLITAGIFIKIFGLIRKSTPIETLIAACFVIFSPGLIQVAHFGTTESLLTMFYMAIVYITLSTLKYHKSQSKFLFFVATLCAMSIATKMSAIVFVALPISIILSTLRTEGIRTVYSRIVFFGALTSILAVIFSPHSIVSLADFLSSMRYETVVGLGAIDVFYTKQFFASVPVLFQFVKIFPYVLGIPVFLAAIAGFVLLPLRRDYHILRLAFLLYFLPSSTSFAKWTRFEAPVFPILVLMAALFVFYVVDIGKKWTLTKYLCYGVIVLFCLPGVAFISIYTNKDVRFTASEWMAQHISPNSVILSETANVVDLPVYAADSATPAYSLRSISFDFYNLDTSPLLKEQLARYVKSADYIIVPSRRIFKNYTCVSEHNKSSVFEIFPENISFLNSRCDTLKEKYPALDEYYKNLFSGSYGFYEVAEFSSYPTFSLLGRNLIFADENAEETWSVFDHPVIRIYKNTNPGHAPGI